MGSEETRRRRIINCVTDSVTVFMWDNRKNDEDLPRGSIEEAVARGEVTVDEMVDAFRKELRRYFEDEK